MAYEAPVTKPASGIEKPGAIMKFFKGIIPKKWTLKSNVTNIKAKLPVLDYSGEFINDRYYDKENPYGTGGSSYKSELINRKRR